MKSGYDFSTIKSRKNPYVAKLKRPVTLRLSEDVIGYFKQMADEAGVPYQSLINLYLRDCVAHHRKIDIPWEPLPRVLRSGYQVVHSGVHSNNLLRSWVLQFDKT